MYVIELAPPDTEFASWAARVTVHGNTTERRGFALPYSAYRWALARYQEQAAS